MDKSTADLKPGPTPDSLSTFDDSSLPNGCVRFHPLHDEVQDDFDAERVGVLDYMPMSRHTTTDASRKSAPVALHRLQIDDSSSPADSVDRGAPASRPDELKNIELTTFRITECRDRRGLMTCSSCASDDDELLGAEADDYLHEVVVQSSGSSRPLPGDGETAPLLRCIPSSFGATRDRAWSRSDMGCESPSVDDGESVIHDLEEDTFTTFRVSSYEGGCVATTTASGRDDEAVEGRMMRGVLRLQLVMLLCLLLSLCLHACLYLHLMFCIYILYLHSMFCIYVNVYVYLCFVFTFNVSCLCLWFVYTFNVLYLCLYLRLCFVFKCFVFMFLFTFLFVFMFVFAKHRHKCNYKHKCLHLCLYLHFCSY